MPLILALFLFATPEWPQFRGPGSTGITADDPSLPTTWSPTKNVAWATTIPGTGWSSPIVSGNLVFLTSVVTAEPVKAPKAGLYLGPKPPAPTAEHRWMAYAVDFASGKIVWEKELHRGVPPQSRHEKNTFAAETPVTDGDHIYAYFGNVGLFCLDRAGKVLWKQSFVPVPTRLGWGTAASPVLHQDRVYIVNDNDAKSYLVALDKKTGQQIWKTDRDEESNWATPYIWQNAQRTEIITPGTKKVRSYDLDGKLLWELGGMSSIAIPSPFTAHGMLYITSGYVGDQTRPYFVLKPGAKGDISLKPGQTSNAFIAWHLPQAGPHNPSPPVKPAPTTPPPSSTAKISIPSSTAASSPSTTPKPAPNSTASSASTPPPEPSPPPLGPTTTKSSPPPKTVTPTSWPPAPPSSSWPKTRSTR
ncbi:MAG: PQQ-binding-like beta-propeller repeat protein [Acidobacteria bacterium]|nr:PQQ-binding-like beta-propeller repeat protein [Acidobacteriota bacterium]